MYQCESCTFMYMYTKDQAGPAVLILKPGAAMEEGKGLDIQGVHEAWQAEKTLWVRMRDGLPFLHPSTGLTADNRVCILNKEILYPMLQAMGQYVDRRLPNVSNLRAEIQQFLENNKRLQPADVANVPGDAIHIRKLLSFVKAKVRREEVSQDLRLP